MDSRNWFPSSLKVLEVNFKLEHTGISNELKQQEEEKGTRVICVVVII
jgi:hypothetical protein